MMKRLCLVLLASFCFHVAGAVATIIETPADLYYPTVNTIAGNPVGKISIVEFYDFNCHYCRELAPMINQILQKNPTVRVVFRDYAMLGPTSIVAAEAAISAQQQGKYLALQNSLLKSNRPLDNETIMQYARQVGIDTQKLEKATFSYLTQQQLRENGRFAKALDIDGVPTLFVAMTPTDTQQMPVDAYKLMSPSEEELQNIINLLKE